MLFRLAVHRSPPMTLMLAAPRAAVDAPADVGAGRNASVRGACVADNFNAREPDSSLVGMWVRLLTCLMPDGRCHQCVALPLRDAHRHVPTAWSRLIRSRRVVRAAGCSRRHLDIWAVVRSDRRANRPILHGGRAPLRDRLSSQAKPSAPAPASRPKSHSSLPVLHRLGPGACIASTRPSRQIHRMNKVNAVAATTT